jgi:peptidoglycan/xylan/chitin deacetylase (PgdA/CDA1 family)
VLPLPDVVRAFRKGLPLPDYAAVITFDDGYENNATVALPGLREAGLTATFFVSASFIGTDNSLWVDQIEAVLNSQERDQVVVRFGSREERIPLSTVVERRNADRRIRSYCKQLPDKSKASWLAGFFAENGIDPPKASGDYRFMSWNQLRALRDAGMTIGSHTLTHAIVTKLAEEDMEREIGGARQACEEALATTCDTFAYPNGRPGDFDARSIGVLRQLGFSCGLTTVHGLNVQGDNPFTLKRIVVGDSTSVPELEAHMSGITDLALRLRRVLKN